MPTLQESTEPAACAAKSPRLAERYKKIRAANLALRQVQLSGKWYMTNKTLRHAENDQRKPNFAGTGGYPCLMKLPLFNETTRLPLFKER